MIQNSIYWLTRGGLLLCFTCAGIVVNVETLRAEKGESAEPLPPVGAAVGGSAHDKAGDGQMPPMRGMIPDGDWHSLRNPGEIGQLPANAENLWLMFEFTENNAKTLASELKKHKRHKNTIGLGGIWDDETVKHLQYLSTFKVERFVCRNSRRQVISDEGISRLVANLRNLVSVQIDGGPAGTGRDGQPIGLNFTDKAVEEFARLKKLRKLELWSAGYLTDEGIAALEACQKLEVLNLPFTRIKATSLSKLSTLKEVSLQSSDFFTDEMISHVAALPNLQSLDIAMCSSLTDGSLEHVARIPKLKKLDLTYNGITDAGIETLAKNTNSLEELELSYCSEITDVGISKLVAMKKLKILGVSSMSITDGSFDHIARLQNLEELYAHDIPNITAEGVRVLSSLKKLRILELPGSPAVEDSFLEHLCKIKTLVELDFLGCHRISDKGVAHLTKLTKLRRLCIGGSLVTNKGLEQIKKMKSLKILWLYDNEEAGYTEEAVETLERSLPECKVFW